MDWAAFSASETDARTRDQLAQPKTYAPADRGAFANFGSGTGNYFMRSLAETARNVSMAGAVLPIIVDKLTEGDNLGGGESQTERYFRAHDEIFQGAVDYWTPKPGTVGKAGEITGQLAAGLLKFIVNPAMVVADAQMGTATDLTRAGVDTGAALVAGDLAGLSTVAGVALPFVGSTVGRKMASGVVGNLVPNIAEAAAKQAVLKAAGAPEQAAQFDPLDPTARGLDVLMGMAFGGAAHYLTRTGQRKFEFTDEQKNALLTVNQARHMERSAGDVPDAALTAHTHELRAAVDNILRGESVDSVGHQPPEPIRAETEAIQSELVRLAAEDAPKPPIVAPDMQAAPKPAAPEAEPQTPAAAQARATLAAAPDLRVPTGEVHPDGSDVTIPAAEFVAKVEADAARAEADGNLFRTAAECLLGAL